MPPRNEDELDPVTLHNQALMNMESDPTSGFEKLEFLVDRDTSPPETFGNLVLLYTKYSVLDSAADLMAECGHLAASMTPYVYEYVDALLQRDAFPEEAFRKLDVLGDKHIEVLRRLARQIQEKQDDRNNEQLKSLVFEYEDEVDR
jgi:tetratricopeptide repeat protein 30